MSEVNSDKLKGVLLSIVDRLPASPSESDTAQLKADIDGLDSDGSEEVETDPTLATVTNPTGIVPSADNAETTTDATAETTTEPATEPAPFQREIAIADVDAFMANATDEQIAALEAFTKTDQ